jgi:SOS-response transcriptional repressor LexA
METEAERYNFIQEKSGFSKKAFAESLGITKEHGYLIGKGSQKPPRDVLERLCTLYRVNLNWFISGQGKSGLEPDEAIIELLDQEAAAGRGREIADYTEKRFLQIPLSLIAPHRPENLQAVYVAGDSMMDEKIFDGDIVIFTPVNPRATVSMSFPRVPPYWLSG